MIQLTEVEIDAALAALPGWRLTEGKLGARYRFADFRAAFAFMTAVAADAEVAHHHPDWSNSYAIVTIGLWTHDASAITARDVALAHGIAARAAEHRGAIVAPPVPSPWPRDIPPFWFLGAILTMLALHWLRPGPRWIEYPWTLTGGALAVLGLSLLLWSAGLFRAIGTGVRPFTPATVLVGRGPYRFTRNPMYLGMVAMLVGAAIALGSPLAWPVPPLFAAVIQQRFIRREEEFLGDRFGERYREFCGRVRRWL